MTVYRGFQFGTNLAAAGATLSGDSTVAGRALYVGGAGNVGLKTVRGSDVVLRNVPAGTVLDVSHQKVYGFTAGSGLATTATDIVSLS